MVSTSGKNSLAMADGVANGIHLEDERGHREEQPRQSGASGRMVSTGDRVRPGSLLEHLWLGRCPGVAWPPQRGAFRILTGLALNPAFSISRARAAWIPMGDDLTYFAKLEPLLEGMRKVGVPGE